MANWTGKKTSHKYHKICTQKTATGTNHRITLTKDTAHKFSGCTFREFVTDNGILLVKSGCEIYIKQLPQ